MTLRLEWTNQTEEERNLLKFIENRNEERRCIRWEGDFNDVAPPPEVLRESTSVHGGLAEELWRMGIAAWK